MFFESNQMDRRKKSEKIRIKRIAFIFNHPFFLGGGEISFLELIKSIDKDLFEPLIVVPAAGEIKDKLQLYDFKVIVCSFFTIKYLDLRRPFFQLLNFIKILKNNHVDLIHVNGSRACFYAGWAGKILRIPVVWHVRESEPDLYLYDALLGCLANVIICVSKSVQLKRFRRFGQAFKKKISVVYNGVDTGKFQERNGMREQTRVQLRVEPNDIFFGLVGNIIPRKAQDFFLKGLALAIKRNSKFNAQVRIIGRPLDNSYSAILKELINDLQLNDIVKFQDYTEEISKIYSALDIFVLSSKSEGFSRALLEAMSCGLPIIASKIEEIEEAIVDKNTAILVDFNDAHKMASAIIRLCENSKLRNDMGKLNRKVVEEHFSIAAHTNAIESIYNGLFDARKRALR